MSCSTIPRYSIAIGTQIERCVRDSRAPDHSRPRPQQLPKTSGLGTIGGPWSHVRCCGLEGRVPVARALVVTVCLFLNAGVFAAAPHGVTFAQSAKSVATYDFVEVAINVPNPPAGNPFSDVEVTGEFAGEGGGSLSVDGFCDSDDGSLFRIRFMPVRPGRHNYSVLYRHRGTEAKRIGTFTARKGKRRGLLRVDREHPWHFVYEGTGEHYFWNSTTAYWLLGWREDSIIRESIDRLTKLKVNRIRVALSGRTRDGNRWKEPDVKPNEKFQFRLEPWLAARPENIEDPGYDVTRFNLEHFRKAERMLRHARERDMIVSLIFHLDGRDKGVDPFGHDGMGGPDELRYYRYVVARLASFANVMWDVTNEYRLFRNDPWAEQMGAFIKECDPYDHLTSVHGHETFNFRTSPWADFAMYQSWDEHGGYDFMLKNREEQAKTGRPMPQVNEEYGYEDHYPFPWGEGRKWPARAADNRRRLAWEMTMAGCYQTTGERANVPGMGGWITGRGNQEMTMPKDYVHMREFFETFEWWKLEPANRLVQGGYCLGKAHGPYIVYLARGGSVRIDLTPEKAGSYFVRRFNPRTGQWTRIGKVRELIAGEPWQTPDTGDAEDWVFVLEKR